jgi:hypothetical protein
MDSSLEAMMLCTESICVQQVHFYVICYVVIQHEEIHFNYGLRLKPFYELKCQNYLEESVTVKSVCFDM